MKVGNYEVYWRHVNRKEEDREAYFKAKKEDIPIPPSESYTECLIVDETTGEVISARRAYCSHMDNFNKKIGRKISFARAVDNIAYKNLREDLWGELKRISPKTLKS